MVRNDFFHVDIHIAKRVYKLPVDFEMEKSILYSNPVYDIAYDYFRYFCFLRPDDLRFN